MVGPEIKRLLLPLDDEILFVGRQTDFSRQLQRWDADTTAWTVVSITDRSSFKLEFRHAGDDSLFTTFSEGSLLIVDDADRGTYTFRPGLATFTTGNVGDFLVSAVITNSVYTSGRRWPGFKVSLLP